MNGQDIRKKKPVELAKNIGVLTQNHYVGYSFSVEEVVRLGRYAYSPGVLARRCDDDERMVELALEKTGMAAQRRQSVLTLSGGELQRTFLAQVFAQDPKYLLLDEPTNHLDLIYQRQVFALIKEWLAQGDRAVISVVHDLSLAKKYGTRALLLDHGCMAAIGDTNTALNRDTLGIPVAAIGVPTVIDASALGGGDAVSGMFVTPRNIDSDVRRAGRLIAYGINLALHRDITVADIDMLVG